MDPADKHDQNEATGTQSKPTHFSAGRPQERTEPSQAPGAAHPEDPADRDAQGRKAVGKLSHGQQSSGPAPTAPESRPERSG